jgi:hypothetical protein
MPTSRSRSLPSFAHACLRAALLFCACTVPWIRAGEGPAGFAPLIRDVGLGGWRGGGAYDPAMFREETTAARVARLQQWSRGLQTKTGKTVVSHWTRRQRELHHDGAGACLATTQEYGDFELIGEYRREPGARAVLHLRGDPQIEFVRLEPAAPSGRVVAAGADGVWHSFRVVLTGSRLAFEHDGVPLARHRRLGRELAGELAPLPRTGPLQLEGQGGGVAWRNLWVREIPADETIRRLQAESGEGMERIFNGTDLAGWAGATNAAAVIDGNLAWQAGNGGHLYWNEELGDFRVRFRFRLPPGGNNGIAIRYPGRGNGAYDGMCELQVLDENYEANRGPIDPRQAHGSAYGLVAARRGYQFPAGEWNFQEITVKGSALRVELNGHVILETDLAKVDEAGAMDGKRHPGRLRSRGFLALAGHRDAVEFRDILLRRE